MINLLAKGFILQDLSPTQLNQLSKVNSEVRQCIDKNRLSLPRMQFERIEVHNRSPRIGLDLRNDEKMSCIKIPRTEVMKYLKHIRVEKLRLSGENDFSFLDDDWLEQISHVEIHLHDKEFILNLLKKFKVSKLDITSTILEINGAEILDSMQFVEGIGLGNAVASRDFFQKLAEKSKNGPGLSNVYLICEALNSFNSEDFIRFLKNAKHQKCSDIYLEIYESERMRLRTMLLLLKEIPNWRLIKRKKSWGFKIKTPDDAVINLKVKVIRWPTYNLFYR